jgi:hypothetical protein
MDSIQPFRSSSIIMLFLNRRVIAALCSRQFAAVSGAGKPPTLGAGGIRLLKIEGQGVCCRLETVLQRRYSFQIKSGGSDGSSLAKTVSVTVVPVLFLRRLVSWRIGSAGSNRAAFEACLHLVWLGLAGSVGWPGGSMSGLDHDHYRRIFRTCTRTPTRHRKR